MTSRPDTNNHAFLRLENLHKSYQEGNRTRVILTGACAEFMPGEFIAIIGKSGSGKSTLLNLISGIDLADEGAIYIRNQNLNLLDDQQRTVFRRQNIGFVFQFHHLLPEFSALENVAMPLLIRRMAAQEARARAAVRCEREDPLLVAIEDVVLSGQIDLWFEEQDGKLVVVDYKTGRLDAPDAAERLESYRLQLRLYAAALARRERKPVKEAWLYFLGEEIAEPVSLGGEDEIARAVREFREAQEMLDFPVRPGARCQWCGFNQSLCPAL